MSEELGSTFSVPEYEVRIFVKQMRTKVVGLDKNGMKVIDESPAKAWRWEQISLKDFKALLDSLEPKVESVVETVK